LGDVGDSPGTVRDDNWSVGGAEMRPRCVGAAWDAGDAAATKRDAVGDDEAAKRGADGEEEGVDDALDEKERAA
jgi:hypothetical protein